MTLTSSGSAQSVALRHRSTAPAQRPYHRGIFRTPLSWLYKRPTALMRVPHEGQLNGSVSFGSLARATSSLTRRSGCSIAGGGGSDVVVGPPWAVNATVTNSR